MIFLKKYKIRKKNSLGANFIEIEIRPIIFNFSFIVDQLHSKIICQNTI